MVEAVVGALKYTFTADTAGLKSGLAEAQSNIVKLSDHVKANAKAFQQQGEAAAKGAGLAQHQMLNLQRQLSDIGTSLAGGMSPFMILAQQGPQVADIFQQTGAKVSVVMRQIGSSVASAFLNIKTLGAGVGVAILGIGAAALSSLHHLEQLADTAKALGTSRQALGELNRQQGLLGLDPAKMNEDMLAFGQAIRKAQIAGGDLSDKLAKIGIDIKSFDLSKPGEFARLFEQIGEKVRNGSNELDKLNAVKFLGLSQEFNRLFSEGGDAVNKFAQDSVGAVESGAKDIQAKWQELRGFASGVWKSIVDNAIDYLWQLKEQAVAIIGMISGAFKDLGIQIEKYWEKLKLVGTMAKQFGSLTPDQATAYNDKIAGLNKQSADINADKGKPQALPQINVGGTDLSSFSLDKAKSGGGKAAKEARDAVKDYIASLKEAAELAQADAANWKLGNVERAKAEAIVKAENIAKKEGKQLTEEQRAAIASYAEQAALAKKNVEDLKRAQDNLNSAMREFADMTVSALDSLIIRGGKAADVLRSLVQTLASSALKGVLTGEGTFGKLAGLSGTGGGLGGILGSIFSFLPKFAEGGTLGAGKWGIAGEAGAELVQGPANIVPLNKMGGQGAKISVHNYAGADVQARETSSGEIIIVVQKMIEANNKKVPSIVANSQRRAM